MEAGKFRLAIFLILAVGGCTSSPTETKGLAAVVFFVHDGAGARWPYRVSQFRSSATGADLAGRFSSELEAKGIPFGDYQYLLQRADLKNSHMGDLKGGISVKEADQFLHLISPPGILSAPNGQEVVADYDFGEPVQMRARVAGYRTTPRTWVHMQKPFSAESAEARVKADGTFRALLPWDGDYILALYEDGTLLYSRAFSVPPNKKAFELQIDVERDLR